MPKSEREVLKTLKRRLLALRRKHSRLQQEDAVLQYQQALLVALCRSFNVLQLNKASQTVVDCSNVNNHDQLLQLHCQLLRQLAISPPTSDAEEEQLFQQVSPLQPDPDDVVRTAPREDPLAYLRYLATQPALPEGVTMSALDLAAVSRDAVLQAALKRQLQLFKTQRQPTDCNNCAEHFEQLWDRYHASMMSVIMHGRPELIAQLDMFNLATLTQSPDNLQAATARRAAIPALLGLSQQQLQDISAGSALFGRLLETVLKQQQKELQAQALSARSSSSSGDALSSMHNDLSTMHNDWEARQHSTGRMQVLLHKEYAIKAATGAFIVGCFSWEQYSHAAVLSWPYPLLLPALVHELAMYYEQQQQGK